MAQPREHSRGESFEPTPSPSKSKPPLMREGVACGERGFCGARVGWVGARVAPELIASVCSFVDVRLRRAGATHELVLPVEGDSLSTVGYTEL